MPLAAQPAAPSALDPLKPLAVVDFAGQRHTPYKQWAAAAKTLDDQARQAEHDRDWEHAWVWSRKAAAITQHLANEHADRSKPENKELLKPLLRLVTSESFKSRIKTSESLLCSRSSFTAPAAGPPPTNGRPTTTSMPPPSASPEPPSPAPMSIKERMAALRGAGLNTGGDEPVMQGSPANRRGSVQLGGPPKQSAGPSTGSAAAAATTTPAPTLNGSGSLREAGGLSRPSSGRGRKRDEVVERLERLAMDPPPSEQSSAASASPSPAKLPSPMPVSAAPLPSSVPLQPTPAPPPVVAPAQPLPPPDVEISSPSPVPPPASVPEKSADAVPEPAVAPPSAVPSRISHGYSASVPSARSASPSRASPTKPPKPPALSIQSTTAVSSSFDPSLASAPEQLGLGLNSSTNGGSPAAQSPRRRPAPVEDDDFSPSRFGHFPSITEFESSTTTFDEPRGVSTPVGEDAPSLTFPSLPSVPLSLPGSAPSTTRPLPSPPLPPPGGAFQTKPQTTGSSVSSFQSALSAPPLASPTFQTAPNGIPADAAAAARPVQQPPAADQPVDFPLANTIFPALLRQYLTLPVELLLLDVRPPQAWSSRITPTSTGGGQADCVCIPPALLSSTLSSQQLADGLPRTSPFHNRHLYDLVVIYNGASTGWAAPGAEGAQAVNRAVYEREFGGKMLKRAPVLLVGGWEAWRAAESGTTGTKQALMSPGFGRTAEMNGLGGSRETSPAAKPSYFPLIPPIAPTQAAARPASSSPNASAAPAFPSPLDLPARPSSTAAPASSSYNHSAPMTVPPAPASLAYPSSRRRSEYVDQTSAYTGYPGSFGSPTSLHSSNGGGLGSSGLGGVAPQRGQSIDYPTLSPSSSSSLDRPPPQVAPHRKSSMSISHPPSSVTSSLPQPPPVAATPPLERNASRGALVRSGSLSFPTLSEDGKLVQSSGNEVTYWGDEMVGLSGLKNLGNTCYQNSTLQCLSATEPFSTFFRDGRWKRSVNFNNNLGTKGNLASAYSSLISALWQQEYHFIQPLSFRKSIVKFAPTFDGVDQHDSQEFLAFLLDGLHEDLNRVLIRPEPIPMTPAREAELNTLPTQIAGEKEWQIYKKRNDSLVVDLFQGQYKSRMECLTCHQTSTTFDAFMYLSLPVPTSRLKHKVSLEHCLDSFVKEEVMEKGNAWNCPKCKKARTASKSLTLSRLPPVLLIHLKRFSTKNGVFWDKAETLVEFPIKYLDLTQYMPPPLSATKDPVAEARYREDPRTQTPPYIYELYAVSNHAGSLTTGHYTAFVKSSQRHWKYCDDRTISEADEKDVMSKHAYILFYRRVPAKRSL